MQNDDPIHLAEVEKNKKKFARNTTPGTTLIVERHTGEVWYQEIKRRNIRINK